MATWQFWTLIAVLAVGLLSVMALLGTIVSNLSDANFKLDNIWRQIEGVGNVSEAIVKSIDKFRHQFDDEIQRRADIEPEIDDDWPPKTE